MTLILIAASAFTAGMLVEAVVRGRAARRHIAQLQRESHLLRADCARWRRAATLNRRAEVRRRRLRAVDG